MSKIVRVASSSEPSAVAGAIAGIIRDEKEAIAQAIGANAVNQMIKAVIIASSYMKLENVELLMYPSFIPVDINGATRTAIRLHIQSQTLSM